MPRDYASLQRRPFLTPIWLSFLSAFFAVGVLGFSAWAGWIWVTANSSTIIVVREAEGETSGADPRLTPAGEARAERLSHVLGNAGTGRLEAIYVLPARRSRLTAQPLASRLGITPIVAEAAPGRDIRSLTRRILREQPGRRTLIVGRRDTVPEIVRTFSGDSSVPSMPDEDYETMYIISVPRVGRANVLHLTY
jgi:broad specificity phosphatase PhoE